MRSLQGLGWFLALALAACAGGPPRHDPVEAISIRDYQGPPLPQPLASCDVLLADLHRWRRDEEFDPRTHRERFTHTEEQRARHTAEDLLDHAHAERLAQFGTREVHARILSFDESYANGRIQAALTAPLNFATEISPRDSEVVQYVFVRVPAGFVTDFNSTPSGPAQAFTRTFGRTAVSAIAHDFLYAVGAPGDELNRRIADRALRRGMDDNDTNEFKRRILFWVVQWRGGDSYGAPRELRFFDEKRIGRDQQRIVRFSDVAPSTLYEQYVEICPKP